MPPTERGVYATFCRTACINNPQLVFSLKEENNILKPISHCAEKIAQLPKETVNPTPPNFNISSITY